MLITEVTTFVDGQPNDWLCEYDEKSLDALTELSEQASNLINVLPNDGWMIVTGLDELRNSVSLWIESTIANIIDCQCSLPEYHKYFTNEMHFSFIDYCRNLRFDDLGIDAEKIAQFFSNKLNLNLSPSINLLGRDHVQVRTVRPGRTDFNPPHRDSYIPAYSSVVNVWVPIVCDYSSTMPVVSGSHLWKEELVNRTPSGEAMVNGNRYNVPAVFGYGGEPLNMIRPPVKLGEALIFTPYLVHGFGVNNTSFTRFAVEFRLQICG